MQLPERGIRSELPLQRHQVNSRDIEAPNRPAIAPSPQESQPGAFPKPIALPSCTPGTSDLSHARQMQLFALSELAIDPNCKGAIIGLNDWFAEEILIEYE